MIITLTGATASKHLGGLNFYSIIVNKSSGITVTLDKTSVSKDTAASETVTGTLTVAEGYTLSSVVIKMGDTDKTSAWYNSSTGAITISGITANVTITAIAASNSGSGDSGSGEDESASIVFTNDEFEVGALDGSGNPVDLTTRYRTKNIKKFSQAVLLTGKVLSGETNPAHVRIAQYNNGTFASMNQFAETGTIPANTEFRLILERSGGGNVTRGKIELTVPAGATRLYVNTLKGDKAISYVKTSRETIQGSAFTDGLYHYGTVGETKAVVTSSSKMAGYNSYIAVNAGETVEVNVFTSATLGCVFTDDNDKVISLGENSTFSGRDYQPLDFFTYEVQ